MGEPEESIYSYFGTLQQTTFLGGTGIHNTDNSVNSSGMDMWAQYTPYSLGRAQEDV